MFRLLKGLSVFVSFFLGYSVAIKLAEAGVDTNPVLVGVIIGVLGGTLMNVILSTLRALIIVCLIISSASIVLLSM